MAAGDIAKQAGGGTQDLATLLNMFKPAGGSSESKTTTENTSPEAVNALVAQILGGNQGLATVAQGQKGAGMYNSTTNQMLSNDLIARTAASAAALNKSTTVTDKITPTAQLNAGKTAAVGAIGMVGNALLKSSAGQRAGNSLTDSILNAIGVGGKGVKVGTRSNGTTPGNAGTTTSSSIGGVDSGSSNSSSSVTGDGSTGMAVATDQVAADLHGTDAGYYGQSATAMSGPSSTFGNLSDGSINPGVDDMSSAINGGVDSNPTYSDYNSGVDSPATNSTELPGDAGYTPPEAYTGVAGDPYSGGGTGSSGTDPGSMDVPYDSTYSDPTYSSDSSGDFTV